MNKLIVVTGGTKGIGRAIAAKFASSGFDVALCARNQDDLDKLKVEFENAYPGKVITHMADLSNRTQVKTFTGFIQGLHRPVHVLVNNAGYFVAGGVMDEAEGSLESMISNNVYSAYYVTRDL